MEDGNGLADWDEKAGRTKGKAVFRLRVWYWNDELGERRK
jgi:hypothetical protein